MIETIILTLVKRNGGKSFFTNRPDREQESARLFMKQIEEEIGESVEEVVANQLIRYNSSVNTSCP
jgi:hypothetical protein